MLGKIVRTSQDQFCILDPLCVYSIVGQKLLPFSENILFCLRFPNLTENEQARSAIFILVCRMAFLLTEGATRWLSLSTAHLSCRHDQPNPNAVDP